MNNNHHPTFKETIDTRTEKEREKHSLNARAYELWLFLRKLQTKYSESPYFKRVGGFDQTFLHILGYCNIDRLNHWRIGNIALEIPSLTTQDYDKYYQFWSRLKQAKIIFAKGKY